MSKRDTMIRALCKSLGVDYRVTTIDLERVIYRDFGNGFNVEISGMHTSSMKKKATIYLWYGDTMIECIIVKTVRDIPRELIGESVEELMKYSNLLIAQGYDSYDKLFRLKYGKTINYAGGVKNMTHRIFYGTDFKLTDSDKKMRKFLKFVHDDVVYCKYYEVVYILFHTGMRISEFCGLTLKDIDFEKMTVNIDHQLQRTSDMRYIIETTKTDAGTRVLPITEDVAEMFQAIIEDRNASKVEKDIDGYSGFLFYDDNGMPLVAMHWQHRFNHMVGRYNDIYRVQMPNITLHVCRHTYCSNMAKPGMNPKTLQYLMGHSDISVTMNVYTHIGFDDAEEELKRLEYFRKAQAEIEKKNEKPMSQKMFKVI